jgi:cysteine desulfurase/selenocysteine lyase
VTTLFDLRAVRAEFPALGQTVHGHRLAYLDSAATSQRPRAVVEAVRRAMEEDNANVHRGVHTLSQRATDAFDRARTVVRRFVGASRDEEIVFTKGCTEAINLVAHSWGRTNLKRGDTVLLSTMEHHADIVPWQIVAQDTGAKLEPIPVTNEPTLDLDWLEARLKQGGVKIVGIKHVCNATGTVNPVAESARLAHRHGALVLVDGAQALAHVPVDVQALGADFYAMSAHKAYGPMGVGALYGRLDLLEAMPPWQGGGDMIRRVSFEGTSFRGLPNKFEPGTPNVPGVVGFATALDWLERTGPAAVREHESALLQAATKKLESVPGLRVVGTAPGKTAVISFVMEQAHAHDVGTVLDAHGVAVRAGHHCCMPLMERLGVPATVRASLAAYSGEDDIDQLVEGLEHVARVFS